jgi:hypothetical protein
MKQRSFSIFLRRFVSSDSDSSRETLCTREMICRVVVEENEYVLKIDQNPRVLRDHLISPNLRYAPLYP